MSSKKTRGPSEAMADGPVLSPEPPKPTAAPALKDFVVRFTPPQGEPIAYHVRCATIADAQATFALTVTEQQPGPLPPAKPPKRFVEVVAAKTPEYGGRRANFPVHAVDDNEAIELAKKMAYENFMFPKGSITQVTSGAVVWKARVLETIGG